MIGQLSENDFSGNVVRNSASSINTSASFVGELWGNSVSISGSPITNITGKITVDKIKEKLYSYCDLGWKIIPMFGMNRGKCQCGKADCDKPGKHPRISQSIASSDKNQVDKWINSFPYCNWAVLLGKESNLILFDIDPQNGGKLDDLPFPKTLIGIQGRDSYHIFFHYPDFPIENNPKFKNGIELKVSGLNSLCNIPPSQYYRGGYYKWENPILPIADLPSEFLELADKEEPNKKDKFILPDEILEGERNIVLFKFGCSLRSSGFDENEILMALTIANDMRCKPPKPIEEVETIVNSIVTRYPKGNDTYGIYEDKKEDNSKNVEIHRWSVSELLDSKFPEPKWSIPDLIPEGLTLFGGRPKVGKSWFMLQAGIAVATGGIFLGKRVEQGNVLYVSFEDNGRRLQERIQKLNIPRDAKITITNEWKPLQERGFDDLVHEIEIYDYRMVILDTLSRAFIGLDQSKNPEKIQHILSDLQTLAINKPLSLVFPDHTRKTSNAFPDPIEDILNTTGKTAVADCVLGLYTMPGKKGAQLRGRGKDVSEVELELFWDSVTGIWQINNNTSETENEIIEALRKLGKSKAAEVSKYIVKDSSNTTKKLQSLYFDKKIQSEIIKGVSYYWIDENTPF